MRRLIGVIGLAFAAWPALAQQQQELDKGWEFRRTDENIWRPATVPGTVHTDLFAHKLIPDPFAGANEKGLQWIDKKDWEYRTTFDVPADMAGQDQLALDFTGLDTYADVYLNDSLILQAQNMFVGKQVAVKGIARPQGNRLRILFHSPIVRDMPKFMQDRIVYPAGNDASDIPLSVHARKAPYHYGWDWGPRYVTSGIWRPVVLRSWNKLQLRDAWIKQQQLTDASATLEATLTVDVQQAGNYTAVIHSGSKAFVAQKVQSALQAGTQTVNIPFSIRQPKRWWPNGLGEAYLYPVTVSILHGKDTIQQTTRRIGLRTVEVVNAPDKDGTSFFVKVNGQPVFMKGANYIPSDNFLPRVTDDRYRKLFRDMEFSHFNMIRVWGGGIYENDIFYDLADEKGILVWQDFMFACTLYPSDPAFLSQVREETAYNIRRLRNHPSLALWCGNNEIGVAIKNWGWKDGYAYSDGQWASLLKGYETLFQELLRDEVKTHDPSRFYLPSSPISNWGRAEDFKHGDNHYWGIWHGMEWFEAFNTHVPRFMSEFGFQSFPDLHTVRKFADSTQWDLHSFVMQSHQKSLARGNAAIQTYMDHYYHRPKDFAGFLYMSQVLQAEGMKIGLEAHRRNMPYCMGTLYWQLNDTWPGPSWSSIDYFGRWKALQYFAQKAFTPMLVSLVEEEGQVRAYVVNDLWKDEKVKLELTLMDLEGKILRKIDQPLTAKGNTAAVAWRMEKEAFLQGADPRKVILYAKLVNENQTRTENVFYFAAPRDLALPVPDIQTEVKAAGGKMLVTVRSAKLAKNVWLLLDKDDTSHFSDNFFDLLPGTSRTVELETSLGLDAVKSQLQTWHVGVVTKP